jgi:hypothetical protein
MDKVWFKLKQTHYPPPPRTKILQGCTGAEGPICLGHVIQDLKRLDFPLNPNTILPLPSNINVFPTTMVDFQWNDIRSSDRGIEMGAAAPIAGAAGVTLGGDVKLAFSKSVGDHEQFEKLDTYIFQPTQSYVANTLAEEPLASTHIKGHLGWSLFIITGICVARKGRKEILETHGREAGASVQA